MAAVKTTGFVLVVWAILWGCVSGHWRPDGTWRADPETASTDHRHVQVSLTPQKSGGAFFTTFQLTVTNMRADDVMIDWNASRYQFNGKPQGRMVFEGIDPAAVKTASIPTDIVPPGVVFTRVVMPMRRIAWRPLKEKTTSTSAIAPGMLPSGQHGMRLILNLPTGSVEVPLAVRIFQSGK